MRLTRPDLLESEAPGGVADVSVADQSGHREADRIKKQRGSVAGLASATYFGLALGLVTSPIVARVLGPAARGEYAAVYIYSTALLTVLALGVPMAVIYRLVHRLDSPHELLGTAIRFTAVLSIPGIAIAVALTARVLDLPAGPATYLAAISLSLAPLGVLGVCLQGFLTAAGSLRPLTWLRVMPLLVNFLGVVLLALAKQLSLVTYLALTIAVAILGLLLAWYLVGVRPRGHARWLPLLKFGLRGYPASFARLLNFQADQVILVPLVSPTQLAFYAIAVTISQLPQSISEAVGTRAMGSVVGPDRSIRSGKTEQYLRLNLLASLIVCAGILVAAPFLIPLIYGKAFVGTVVPLLLLLPGSIASAGTSVAAACLNTAGRPGVTSAAEASALAITAVGLLVALPRFGIAGAAAVSSIAYTYRYIVQLVALRRFGVRQLLPKLDDVLQLINALPHPRLSTAKAAG